MSKVKAAESLLSVTDRYSIFGISEQNFAVEIKNIKEVVPLPKITKVPNVHKSILGVFNLRGKICSIMDIRVLLKIEQTVINEDNFIVLMEWEEFMFGIVVDRVLDVRNLDTSKIQVPTRELTLPYIQYLNGFYEHTEMGVIYLLDIQAIMQSKEIIRYRYF